jgi:uncharacterized protein (DUF58 family)
MGMQTQVAEAQQIDPRAVQTQRRLLLAAWVMAVLLAALLVALLVQSARIADLERSVQQSQFSGGSGSDANVTMQLDQVCRLLGAVAEKSDVPVASVFDGETMSTCEAAAGQGASAVRSSG